jgi:hypothetical protein
MSEPLLPLPEPETSSYWDNVPGRCPECGAILQNLHPASRADNELEGWCPEHGQQLPVYGDGTQIPEYPEEEE